MLMSCVGGFGGYEWMDVGDEGGFTEGLWGKWDGMRWGERGRGRGLGG